ncbi:MULTISPECIES: hydrogenase maturation nickel metallochaperone HypA [Achromobacter]|uniref:hydrogenase maturation nickel metallochaperone HypA n=1 Tax=Achromobacter TaxID=222 RepID=UPI0020744D99|nr:MULTISPECIES: hydrogenase maturation nickel metallochaperone HypA [Achromobacter]WLW64496.1 hydrogenase maturation nickel metallochaperone HypA [Achromobacter aegrifaciens]
MAARKTKRPQNACRECGHTWYPRGNSRSLKCPNCGNRDVKIVGPGILGAAVLAGFLFLSSGNKPDTSKASAPANPAVNAAIAQTSPAPAAMGTPQRQEQALSVPKAPNGATWPTGAGYVNGYESRDFGGSVVNLVNQKTGNAFFVKLVSSARGVQFSSRHVYVGPNQQFSIVNVAPGDYYLAFQDLMSRKFYRTKDFSLTQGPSSVDAGRLRYTTIGFEFTGQGGGYEDAQQIPAADFGGR